MVLRDWDNMYERKVLIRVGESGTATMAKTKDEDIDDIKPGGQGQDEDRESEEPEEDDKGDKDERA